MCLVSEKIKFCTCVTDSVDKLNNYWILYRFDKTKDDCILGIPSMPPEWGDPNFVINNHTLEVRLNEPDAFDIPMKFKAKDQFEIVINNRAKDQDQRLIYCFIYKKGSWAQESYDVFELINQYEEFTFGKMKGIKKKTKLTT